MLGGRKPLWAAAGQAALCRGGRSESFAVFFLPAGFRCGTIVGIQAYACAVRRNKTAIGTTRNCCPKKGTERLAGTAGALSFSFLVFASFWEGGGADRRLRKDKRERRARA